MDEVTAYMLEKGIGSDLHCKDNTGKSAYEIAGSAPVYQGQLRGYLRNPFLSFIELILICIRVRMEVKGKSTTTSRRKGGK